MAAFPRPNVHIYIDNSNIYIQGAKIYSSGSSQQLAYDLTWRYDINSLRNILCNNSDLHVSPVTAHTTLYGSQPPPGDIWQAMESQDVKVHIYDRSSWNGKEKEVDTKMVADISRQATKDEIAGFRSEFIIVSGDKDINPAVEVVIESGLRAHMWSWQNSFSSAFKETWDSNGTQTITLHYLDHFRNQFSYHQSRPSVTWCNWGIYCNKNVNCRNLHSQSDTAYFAQHGGPKPLQWYWPCSFGSRCNKPNECGHYHNDAERLCPTCDQYGQGHGEVGSTEWLVAHGPH